MCDKLKIVGAIMTFNVGDKVVTVVKCPHCGELSQITGKVKHHKVVRCWSCQDLYLIP
jgi:phage FluMu protein Com